MIILAIKTDNPVAELSLWNDSNELGVFSWEAHRQLADTIHVKLLELLDSQTLDLRDIEGIIVYKGPGSFTGLRIGISVANALAYSLNRPIASEGGDSDWKTCAIERLINGDNEQTAVPFYGADANITAPKK